MFSNKGWGNEIFTCGQTMDVFFFYSHFEVTNSQDLQFSLYFTKQPINPFKGFVKKNSKNTQKQRFQKALQLSLFRKL